MPTNLRLVHVPQHSAVIPAKAGTQKNEKRLLPSNRGRASRTAMRLSRGMPPSASSGSRRWRFPKCGPSGCGPHFVAPERSPFMNPAAAPRERCPKGRATPGLGPRCIPRANRSSASIRRVPPRLGVSRTRRPMAPAQARGTVRPARSREHQRSPERRRGRGTRGTRSGAPLRHVARKRFRVPRRSRSSGP
jgi:hypothetical protein